MITVHYRDGHTLDVDEGREARSGEGVIYLYGTRKSDNGIPLLAIVPLDVVKAITIQPAQED